VVSYESIVCGAKRERDLPGVRGWEQMGLAPSQYIAIIAKNSGL